jgi:hypothetical protein
LWSSWVEEDEEEEDDDDDDVRTTGFLIKSCVSADCDRFVGCHHVLEETEEIENFTCCENLREPGIETKGFRPERVIFINQ